MRSSDLVKILMCLPCLITGFHPFYNMKMRSGLGVVLPQNCGALVESIATQSIVYIPYFSLSLLSLPHALYCVMPLIMRLAFNN